MFKNQLNIIKTAQSYQYLQYWVFLALIAIPIHLEINGKTIMEIIFFHFIFSFGLLLNFEQTKFYRNFKNKNKYLVVKESIFYSSIIIFSLFVLILTLNILKIYFIY